MSETVIDVNVNIGAWPRAVTVADDIDSLVGRFARSNVDRAVVGHLGSVLHDPLICNRELVESLRPHPGLAACWVAVPPTPGEAPPAGVQVDQGLEQGVTAFRIYPVTHDFDPLAASMAEFYSALQEHSLPLCLDRDEVAWNDVADLAQRWPDLKIVMSNLGYRDLRRLAEVMTGFTNVYLDTAGFTAHQGLEWLVSSFGSPRVLFGSGGPVRDLGESLARIAWSGLNRAERDDVLGLSAGAVFTRLGEEKIVARDGDPEDRPDAVLGAALRGEPVSAATTEPVIDIHAHAGPYHRFYIPDSDPASMIEVMDKTGVTAGVLSAHRAIAQDSHKGNDESLQAVDAHPGRLAAYLVVNPWQDPDRELDRIAQDRRFVGIKLHPDLHEYPLTGRRYRRTWDYAAETGCPVLTHTWAGSEFSDPDMVGGIMTDAKGLRVLLGHSGALPHGMDASVDVAAQNDGAVLEICGSKMTSTLLRDMLGAVGAQRVAFGSDFPFIDQRVSLGRVVSAGLNSRDLSAILSGNARQLLSWRTTPLHTAAPRESSPLDETEVDE